MVVIKEVNVLGIFNSIVKLEDGNVWACLSQEITPFKECDCLQQGFVYRSAEEWRESGSNGYWGWLPVEFNDYEEVIVLVTQMLLNN